MEQVIKMANEILIVDDDKNFVKMIEYNLAKEGYSVDRAYNGPDAIKKINGHMPDLVLLDLKMPGMDGMETLKQIKDMDGNVPVVMVSGAGDVQTVVDAMKMGAYDYITKPLKPEEVVVTARNALNSRILVNEVNSLKTELKDKYKFDNILGNSGKIKIVFKMIENALNSSVTVLIQGESGTGKELVARAIHYNGSRKDGPFVVVNCAAIPETLLESELFGYERGAFTGALDRRMGKFEQADRGTIFMDEIGEMSPQTQAKVLRVLESKEFQRLGGNEKVKVDVRIISATNKDLGKEVHDNKFREDLYYRLAVFPIVLPPLRERKEDIPLLAEHFMNVYSKATEKNIRHISKEAMDLLIQYSWPGNIRELENVIERAIVLCEGDTITLNYLPVELDALARKDSCRPLTDRILPRSFPWRRWKLRPCAGRWDLWGTT